MFHCIFARFFCLGSKIFDTINVVGFYLGEMGALIDMIMVKFRYIQRIFTRLV